MTRSALLALLCLLALAPRPAPALAHDPALAWQTLASPRFDIHFHQGLESLAPRVAALCERRFDELSARFQFHPTDRIQVVLADESDEANGESTAWPYDSVFLIVAPPDEEQDVWEMDAWMDYVVSHELVHIFHLDHAAGVPAWLRGWLGRNPLTLPNYYQPDWVLEGLATWAETDPARGVGRGISPYYRGLMRLEVEAGLKRVRRVNQPWRAWPGGGHYYLYGVYFMEFLEACYGRDSVRQWVDAYSHDWLPYFINRNAKQVYKQKLPGLWSYFAAWLKTGPGEEARAIRARGVRGEPASVADAGGNAWGPYKAGVAVRRDGLTRPRFEALEGGEWRSLGEAYPAYFWPTPGRILYTEDEVRAQSGLTRDLWSMDRASGQRRRLTRGLRVQEAVECGGQVLALLGEAGQKRLVRLDGGAVAETLWQGAGDESVAGLCPAPDGRRLAAAHWRQARGWDVEEFDLATRAWLPRASRPESEVQPSYSADGRTLYFSAAYGGTFNVYALDLEGGAVTQLTDVVGGAYHPWPGPAGTLYFSLLTVKGFVLGQAPLTGGPPPPPAEDAHAPQLEPLSPTALAPAAPYAPLPTLWPTWWSPVLGWGRAGLLGAETSGQDVLGRHQWALQGYSYLGLPGWDGAASYTYARWWPQLSLEAADDLQPGDRSLRTQQWAAGVDLPWSGTWRNWDFSAAYGGYRWADGGGDAGYAPLSGAAGTLMSLSVAYDSTDAPSRALGAVDGLQASASWTRRDAGLPDELQWFSGSLARPSSLGRGVVLEASLSAGSVSQGGEAFTLVDVSPLAPGRRLGLRPTLSLDGYNTWSPGPIADTALPGYVGGHLGLRIPIAPVEWGIMAPPVGVDRVYARAYANGVEGLAEPGASLGLANAGFEMDVGLVLAYVVEVEVAVGYARGLTLDGVDDVYLRVAGVTSHY